MIGSAPRCGRSARADRPPERDARPRSAGRADVGVALQDVVRVLALQPIEQRRIAIEVIEVLQQAEAVDLRQIRIGLGCATAAVTSIATCS